MVAAPKRRSLPTFRRGVSMTADLAVGGDVVRNVPIELVDLASRHELVDLYRVRASDCDGLQFFISYFDVAALGGLKALNDVFVADGFARDRIGLAVFDTIPCLPVDQMKSDRLPLRDRGEELNRTRDEGQLEIALPVSARS